MRIVGLHVFEFFAQILRQFDIERQLLFQLENFRVQGGDQCLAVGNLLTQYTDLLQRSVFVFFSLFQQFLGIGYFCLNFLFIIFQFCTLRL